MKEIILLLIGSVITFIMLFKNNKNNTLLNKLNELIKNKKNKINELDKEIENVSTKKTTNDQDIDYLNNKYKH